MCVASRGANIGTHTVPFAKAVGGVRLPVLNPASRQNFGAVDITAFDAGEAVEVVTVDSLELPVCALIKVDVEGMEARTVEEMGYRAWWLIANYFNPANWFGNVTNIFPTVEPAADLFCVPAEREATVKGLEPVLGTGDTWRAAAGRIVARQA